MAELTAAEVEQRRQAATKHGARSYLSRVEEAAPITASMADVERSVLLEIETDGPRERVKKQAARLATAAELLWGHMLTSPEEFRKGLKTWGWLVGAEIRAWRDWHAMGGKGSGPSADDILEGLKREQGQ